MSARLKVLLAFIGTLSIMTALPAGLSGHAGAAAETSIKNLTLPMDVAFTQCPRCHQSFDSFANPKLTFRHALYAQKHIARGLVCRTCHETFPHQPRQMIIKPAGATCDRCHTAMNGAQHAPGNCDLCHPADFLAQSGVSTSNYRHNPPPPSDNQTRGQIDVSLPVVSGKCSPCHVLGVQKEPVVRFKHSTHFKKGIRCQVCHTEPPHVPGQPPRRPQMLESCSRCHGVNHKNEGMMAPKRCDFCHKPDFPLRPAWHTEPWLLNHKFKYREGINCFACHEKNFCVNCHGLGFDKLPHPPGWREKLHRQEPVVMFRTVCLRCHYRDRAELCESCHHKDYKEALGPWVTDMPNQNVHPQFYKDRGAKYCFSCHTPVFCPRCHVRGVDNYP